jgi:isopentenyl-diphosphate delta-isomerase
MNSALLLKQSRTTDRERHSKLQMTNRGGFSMTGHARTDPGPAQPIVSFDSEPLILVDELDREIGHLGKSACHQGEGVLHRAFSLFIFNDRGELLLQQRSGSKPLWPLYWSNSCCSHPRRGETMSTAIHRRLYEELGMRCPLQFLFKFRYQAQFNETSAEHELCSVFGGLCSAPVRANLNELAGWRWVHPQELDAELAQGARGFTPWFLLEWTKLREEHGTLDLSSLLTPRTWAFR